jgi:hypothetical protein
VKTVLQLSSGELTDVEDNVETALLIGFQPPSDHPSGRHV